MRAATRLLAITSVTIVALTAGPGRADFTFGEPVEVETVIPVIDPVHDSIDCLSYDGLEIYIESDRPGGYGGIDSWVIRRGSTDDDWAPPELLGVGVNSPGDDGMASISADGLTLYFFSYNRPGGFGHYDIYMATRPTRNDAWGPATNLGSRINTSSGDGEPWISPDGLELYVHTWRPGGYGLGDIYVARRPTQSDPWGEAVNLGPIVNSEYDVQYPSLSPDGLLLLFCDGPFYAPSPGGYGNSDMWMAKRASLSDPWQPLVNLGPKVNGLGGEYAPRISPDGHTLYFSAMRGSSYGNWQASIIPICDFNGDGQADGKDVLIMADCWGQDDRLCDIGPFAWGDGIVDVQDLKVLAAYIGKDVEDPTFIAHWAFDETQGNTAHDSVGGNDATVMGTALWQPEGGKIGGALQLSGAPNFVTTKLARDPSAGPFSVFAWVKGSSPGQVILSQTGGVNWLMAGAGTGALTTEIKQAGTGGKALVSSCVITDGNWHRVGLVWDGSNRILYVDDIEVAKDTQPNLPSSTGNLSIGAGSTMAPTSFWKGLIDDVRIYDRAVKP